MSGPLESRSAAGQMLNITVHEAWGISKEEEPVWDQSFTEGFVKIELRGEQRSTTRVKTNARPVENYSISWKEELNLFVSFCLIPNSNSREFAYRELTDAAKELRIMLCKEKLSLTSNRPSSSVVAACGIYVQDILQAVPIDKAFELFKPGEQEPNLGGYIRVTLTTAASHLTITPIDENEPTEELDEEPVGVVPETSTDPAPQESSTGSPGGRAMKIVNGILFLAGVAAAVVFFRGKVQQRKMD